MASLVISQLGISRLLRIYVDTSVFGGCFDDQFSVASRQIFENAIRGMFRLVISDTTLVELAGAPDQVQAILQSLSVPVEYVRLTEEIEHLRDAYIAARVVGPASLLDAEHIASASVADVDLIVSWNFRHIVHYEKISGYHGVNLLNGYRPIRIFSPLEVV